MARWKNFNAPNPQFVVILKLKILFLSFSRQTQIATRTFLGDKIIGFNAWLNHNQTISYRKRIDEFI